MDFFSSLVATARSAPRTSPVEAFIKRFRYIPTLFEPDEIVDGKVVALQNISKRALKIGQISCLIKNEI